MNAIEFYNVWEKYRIKFIKEEKVHWEEIWALEDISFKLNTGEVLGIIGQNGAGKTTLLKLIAGMLMPDKGKIDVEGRVAMLMELGAGFNPEFTGRENVTLNARIYGFDEEALNQQMEKIVEFAGLGSFIDAPVKYYSQGMYTRLAFALAIHVNPDILLIDDILAVGDEEAQQKCINKIFELKQSGKTIVLVSHDMNMINRLCNRVILLHKSRIVKDGLPQQVIQHYLETVGDKRGITVLEKDDLRVAFNNGKLNFSYNDGLLTKGTGAFVSFLLPEVNLWSSSSNLSWQIKSSGINEIIAEGRSHEEAVSLIWKIQIEEKQLQCKVELKDEALKDAHMNFFLISDYKEWVSLEKEGEFPVFAHKLNWKEIDFSSHKYSMLGLIPDAQNYKLPFLAFEIEDNRDCCFKLFNTGYEQESRVIQLPLSGNETISAIIKFFPERDEFEDYIKQERQKLLLRQQEEEVRLRASRSIKSDDLYLFADLEARSLRLYFKDKEITRSPGLHISFLSNGSWHDTSSCDWQVRKEDETLHLNFTWKELQFTSKCTLYFKDNSLIWQAECDYAGSFDLDPLKFGLLLIPEYRKFFCGHQEGKFPEEFSIWQDIPLQDVCPGLFGLKKENILPAVTLKNKNNFTCVIQNSDAVFSCRGLQLCLHKDITKDKNFSFDTEIAFLGNESSINKYLIEKKELWLLRKKTEEELIYAKRNISQGAFRLFADTETKILRLYYMDEEITQNKGLYATVYNADTKRWFHSYEAEWEVEKISEEELVLSFNYEELLLTEIWTLCFKEENSLEFNIKFKAEKPLLLNNRNVSLEIKDKFKNWFTAYEKGDFSVNKYIADFCPIRLKDHRVSRVILDSGSNTRIPRLFFEASSQPDKRILGINKLRKDTQEEYICLDFSLVVSRNERTVKPGTHTYFQGKIILGKDIKLEKENLFTKSVEFAKNDLKFIFDRGRGKVFLGEKELTSGLGLYTAVRSLGIWLDSYQATWMVNKKEDNKIIVCGDWPFIPISQIWQIKLIDKNSIFCKVDMEVYEDMSLEVEQVNLMLSPEYKAWIIPDVNNGGFLDEYSQYYDFSPFRFWYGKADKIVVTSDCFPKITFESEVKNDYLRAVIENTDDLHQARRVQYQKINVNKTQPGKYLYFQGIIKLEI